MEIEKAKRELKRIETVVGFLETEPRSTWEEADWKKYRNYCDRIDELDAIIQNGS